MSGGVSLQVVRSEVGVWVAKKVVEETDIPEPIPVMIRPRNSETIPHGPSHATKSGAAAPNATYPQLFLPQISPTLRHHSPVLSVLAPGSRAAQKNGGKTARSGRKPAEK